MGTPADHTTGAAYLPKLYAGQRPADFGEYRDQEARLAGVAARVLVVMGEQDPDFGDLRAEGGWIARALRGHVVMVSGAGHYPRSQRPDVTTGAVLRFLGSVRGCARAGRRAAVLPGVGAAGWGYCR